jgi:hypothetical protein
VEYEAGDRLWPAGIPSEETFGQAEVSQGVQGNRFDQDPHCQAVWKFENNLLDSLGGNHLTGGGDPPITFDETDKKEGQCSADFEWDHGNYASRPDADLSPGFPLKSGDTNKKISLCLWVNPETVWLETTEEHKFMARLAGKWRYGAYSLLVCQRKDKLTIFWGYNGGASTRRYNTGIVLPQDEWSHIGVVVDGVAKTIYVRVYRVSNDTIYEYSQIALAELAVTTAIWGVADRGDGYDFTSFDGKLDELVVFDDLLTPQEIDEIRQGIYYHAIKPASIDSAEQVGLPAVLRTDLTYILPPGIASQEAVGTPVLQTLTNIQPAGIASQESLGAAQVKLMFQQIFPGSIPTGEAWGQAQVQGSAVTILPPGIASQEALGTPEVVPGTATVQPEGIPSGAGLGEPSVIPGAVEIAPQGIPSGEQVGQPKLVRSINPASIPSAEEFGAPTLLPGPVQVLPGGIGTQQALGVPTVIPGLVTVLPQGIGSGEEMGEPLLGHNIRGIGIGSGESFGNPTIIPGPVEVLPRGIDSEEAVGRVRLRGRAWADLIVLDVEALEALEFQAKLPDLNLEAAPMAALEFTDGLPAADLYATELKAVANG